MENITEILPVSPPNLLSAFKTRVEEAMGLVEQMSANDTIEAVQYWNVYSERLQELVYHTAEAAEIDAIEAMALDLEQSNIANSNMDVAQEVICNSDSLPILTSPSTSISNVTEDCGCSSVNDIENDIDCLLSNVVLDSPVNTVTIINDNETILNEINNEQNNIIDKCTEIIDDNVSIDANIIIDELSCLKSDKLYNKELNENESYNNKIFISTICEEKFPSDVDRLGHEKKHNNEKMFTCSKNECSAKFHTKSNLLRHTRSHVGVKPWQCSVCLNRFTESKSLKVHMRKHTGERPYSCKICNKSFAQSGILTSHLAMHMNSKSFTCDQCGHAFRQKSQLKLHLQRHAGIRRFSCPECDYKFLTKGDMERHQRTHTGERPFHCKLCGKSYTRQQSLKEHINRHYGQKPYSCKHCFKAFAEMSACYKHIKSHKLTDENSYKNGTSIADDIILLFVENNSEKTTPEEVLVV